jgi:hypothetical protein
MKRAPNLDKGNPAAKAKNSPRALPKSKGHGMDRMSVDAKGKNAPAPMAKSREGQTYRPNPSSVPPRDLPHDERIHRELTTGKRSNSHNRRGN